MHHSSKKLKIELPYDLAIPLLCIYPEKAKLLINLKNTCTPICIAASFTIANIWKQAEYPWPSKEDVVCVCVRVCVYIDIHTHMLFLFSHPVMSNSLWPHVMQHARPLCPSSSPEVFPSSCSWHWWCHTDVSFSNALFSFYPWYFLSQSCVPFYGWVIFHYICNTNSLSIHLLDI